MSRLAQGADDLVVSCNFIRAVREAGYLSISTALAELVDNSLQATATEVAITIRRVTPDGLPEITVEDNGIGMTKGELEQCLRFGGSSRFDARQWSGAVPHVGAQPSAAASCVSGALPAGTAGSRPSRGQRLAFQRGAAHAARRGAPTPGIGHRRPLAADTPVSGR